MRNGKGGKRAYDEDETEEEEIEEPVKKKAKNGVKVRVRSFSCFVHRLTFLRTSSLMLSRARHLQHLPLHPEPAVLLRTDQLPKPRARARRNREL